MAPKTKPPPVQRGGSEADRFPTAIDSTDRTPDPLAQAAHRANSEHALAMRSLLGAIEHAREAGQALIDAKLIVGHRRWLPWLKANFNGSPRTAQNYMRVGKHWEEIAEKRNSASHLSMRAALTCIRD